MNIGIDARFLGTETGIGRYVEELVKNLEKIGDSLSYSENLDLKSWGEESRGSVAPHENYAGCPSGSCETLCYAQNERGRTQGDREGAQGDKREYFIFLTEKNWDLPSLDSGVASNFHKVKANFRWYSWQEQVYFPFLIKKYKIDLMHFPHFNVPLFCPCPFVVTIHDLILLHYPSIRASTLGPIRYYLKYIFYRLILKHAIINSKAILAPSKFTKKDILQNFKIPENKIIITYEGISLDDVKPAKKKFLNTLKIIKPYFLTVGNAYPHKNLERWLRVFKRFNKSKKYQFVFVGLDNYFYKRLCDYGRELGLSVCYSEGAKRPKNLVGGAERRPTNCTDRPSGSCETLRYAQNERGRTQDDREEAQDDKLYDVIMPGRVSDSELKTLYLNAFAYVFPSFYEGFGLPGLEAMNYGVPVIAADYASLPEIYGNAAFYFNSKSDDEMFDALVRIVEDDKLREKLVENGYKMIKRYSWRELAKKTLDVYISITKNHHQKH